MIPYALSAFYCLKLTIQAVGMKNETNGKRLFIWIYSILGSAYGIWMLYASNITNILISALLYAPGVFLYIKTKREDSLSLFPRLIDKIVLIVLMVMAIVSLIMIVNGQIRL